MEPLSDFLGVALVVQRQQPGEDFTSGRLADCVAQPLLRLVEAVAQIEAGPAVGSGNGLIHLDMKFTEFLDVGSRFSLVMEAVVGLRQPLLPSEHDLAATARDILSKAKTKGCDIVLPIDAVVAKKFEANTPSRAVAVDSVGGDEMILDIGPRSVEYVISSLARAKTLVWNGPFGAFELEPFDNGTVEVAEAAAELTGTGKLVSIAGGGDTVAALNAAGVTERFTYVSTAGGAFLEWLEGKALPGVEILR